MDMIRLLRADEIECRVSTINDRGVSLLLYKDARVDQRILDETFTPLGWQRTHQSIDGNLYCTVSIWDEDKKQWISKQDVGTAGYTEQEKSQASDSFKRACFNIGIGRELYTAPDSIWVPANKVEMKQKNGKWITYDRFHVRSIEYNDQRGISSLVIANSRDRVVYSWTARAAAPKKEEPESGLSRTQMNSLQKELDRTGVALESVLKRYGLNAAEEMDSDTYKRAIGALKRTKGGSAA